MRVRSGVFVLVLAFQSFFLAESVRAQTSVDTPDIPPKYSPPTATRRRSYRTCFSRSRRTT